MSLVKYCASLPRHGFLAGRAKKRFPSLQYAKFSTESERLTVSYAKGPERPIFNQTVGQFLENSANKFSDTIFVNSIEQSVKLSYAEVLHQADRLAAGLLSLGLQKDDRVALWSPNCWEYVIANFAISRAGLVMVAMNPLIEGADAVHCLSLTKVSAVIAPEEHQNRRYHDMLVDFAPELCDAKPGSAKCAKFPYLRAAICLKGKTPDHAVSISELSAATSEADITEIKNAQTDINPNSACYLQFSSGTTGKPKAVAISHKSFTNNTRLFSDNCPPNLFNQHVIQCVQVPFFHAFGLVGAIGSVTNLGGTLIVPSIGYNPKENLKAIISEKCTMICGTPTMFLDLLRRTEIDGRPQHSIEVGILGGAPLLPHVARDILGVLNVKKIVDVYGLSEATAVCFQSTPTDTLEQTCNTVGKPVFNLEVKIVDELGKTVPVNTPGELWVRGYSIMIEYFDQPEVTAKTVTEDGWLKTGDRFVIDEDGYGKVVGRIKDIIIRGGENISPTEVEQVLITHDAIIDAQVIGVDDERLGEEVCACLLVREPVTARAIRQFCKGKMSSYKIPRYLYVLKDGEAFPRTASVKVQKHLLRDKCNALLREEKLLDAKKESD